MHFFLQCAIMRNACRHQHLKYENYDIEKMCTQKNKIHSSSYQNTRYVKIQDPSQHLFPTRDILQHSPDLWLGCLSFDFFLRFHPPRQIALLFLPAGCPEGRVYHCSHLDRLRIEMEGEIRDLSMCAQTCSARPPAGFFSYDNVDHSCVRACVHVPKWLSLFWKGEKNIDAFSLALSFLSFSLALSLSLRQS